VADAVGDRQTLELLHALTEADAAATGPGAWSEWKAGLVAELVDRTAAVLAGEPYDDPDPLNEEQRALAETGELGVTLTGSRLTIVAPDRAGLLWRWAAVATMHRLLIRSASAVSVDRPGAPMAVTTFDVAPRFGSMPDLDALRTDVRLALADPTPLAAELARREQTYAAELPSAVPPRVLWVDDASHTASVVEVRAHDALGLLYRLTRALADAGLDVRSARVNTLGAEAVDTFYVADPDGQPVTDPARREEIEGSLLRAAQTA
jgi:[protein-PII] uridylyltransferase